jgi:hypothetical protein
LPQIESLGDQSLAHRLGAEKGVDVAVGERLQSWTLRLVGHDLRVLDVPGQGDAGDLELVLEVILVRATSAYADLQARQLVRGLIARVGSDEVVVRGRVVRLRHVEPLHAVGVDRSGSVCDVPPVVPVASRDFAPLRRREAGLDTEIPGDELHRLVVVARHFSPGELVSQALRIGRP